MSISDRFFIPTVELQHSNSFANYLDRFFYSGDKRFYIRSDKTIQEVTLKDSQNQTLLKIIGWVTGLFIIAAVYKLHRCLKLSQFKLLEIPKGPALKTSKVAEKKLIRSNSSPALLDYRRKKQEDLEDLKPIKFVKESYDVRMEKLNPTIKIEAVPVDGIKVGLKNNGNTCWLNSFLQFVACTNFYDSMLKDPIILTAKDFLVPLTQEEMQLQQKRRQDLQAALRNLINVMRTQKEGVVSDKVYKKFENELQNHPELKHFANRNQEDAVTFLMSLTQVLKWKPLDQLENQEFSIIAKDYRTPQKTGIVKYGRKDGIKSQIDIAFTTSNLDEYEKYNQGFELSDLITDRGIVEVRPDQGYKFNMELIQKKRLLRLPNTIMIYLERGCLVPMIDQEEPLELKITGRLLTDKNKQIKLIEYEAKFDKEDIVEFQPRRTCFYRIGATMTHLGVDNGGHFICNERTKNGQLRIHNDSITEEASEDDLGEGYFIRLDLVKSEPIANV